MAEWINDLTKQPTVLVAHGGRDPGPHITGSVQNRLWIVDHEQRPACGPADFPRAKAVHAFACGYDPEPRLVHAELRHNVITFANEVQHLRPKGCLIKLEGGACSLHPQFRLMLVTLSSSTSDFDILS